jgi:hypothetical protein
MKLWIIYFESANYCGYGQHCLVLAESEDGARDLAIPYAEDYYQEEDYDQYVEEYGEPEWVTWSNVISCEEFTPEHESWQFAWQPDQEQFYERINLPEGYKHD